MKTYYTNDFYGHYPVGTGAVVRAKDKTEARRKFRALFKKDGLQCQPGTWTVHELAEGPAVMLSNGNY